nr:hypothetical protein [Planctomycetota bacterium]
MAAIVLVSGEAAAAVGTTTVGTAAAASQVTISHIVPAGSERLLVVTVAMRDTTDASRRVSTVTFGGVALTRAIDQQNDTNDVGAAVYFLIAPTVSTANVVVTLVGSVADLAAAATNLTNMTQVSPLDVIAGADLADTASPSTSITSITHNSVLISTITRNVSGVMTSAQTELCDQSLGANAQHVASSLIQTTMGAQAMAYSAGGATDDWAQALAAFRRSVVIDTPTNSTSGTDLTEYSF